VIPNRIVDAKTDKPAEQQVELQPFHQLAFRADRVNSFFLPAQQITVLRAQLANLAPESDASMH
jgi:hypothetical protein